MDVNGRNSGFSIDGVLEARITPLINPVTGEENEVQIVFPGDDHTGQSAFFAPVEWTNQK